MSDTENIGRREQLRALIRVAKYRPRLIVAIIFGGVFAALLEGVGLGFILPIVEIVQSSGDPAQQADGIMLAFVRVYKFLGIPFTLGFVVVGVSAVLTARWTLTFFVRWMQSALSIDYTRYLQRESFDHALDARIEYFDQEGSDDILNAIVTQSEYAGRTIRFVINFIEQGFLTLMYLLLALVIAPFLTLFAVIILGGFAVLFRFIIESGYDLGDEVADANEEVQQAAQAGTQGIRDTKLFGLKSELFDDFLDAVNQYASSSIRMRRNEQAIQNFYNLLTAISVFVLIYVALTFANLSLGALGVFLFAMFRLGPKASGLNSKFYRIENNLPHLVRTQQFIDELARNTEPTDESEAVPDEVQTVEFDDARFSYEGQEDDAISGVSFEFEKGEFIGFVGQSGAGKSTIVSLLVRMYEPDSGVIRANGRSIHEMDINEWRSRIAVVRQDPFIFNDTLRYNLTIGNRNVSEEELDRVVRIAKVDEFFDDLPEGYETQLGDDGVRLSGGQRQRVALARALLKDADVLVLDEATSDLDSNLEKKVQQSIENMERDYAMIGIAHRLSTVKNTNRIYSVDEGKIVETGEHEELIDQGGQYAELYAIQSRSG
ncbi:ATP-binding cassette subfamily B bacterial MsbA protein [Halorhabdus tiamatea SARL4B]|uniref:ABC transporter, ATP-binding/permease protein n=1 Tax=Halorhabdus tiamatea SARL4B TaxID=1033806 RepID=F7PGC1_9EURY|nr:ABC transporter ATP-binding protein [Halorhabdus tiamatea]ERJ05393.1 ATP-binding cassette subfamily B bacterial MsbA protein [Halorhabdus tiamatea SARL4B]CCQ33135.1 ABC transporter, ATP-binding/permease protein [Halorhabdus tiamatea SARL4B]